VSRKKPEERLSRSPHSSARVFKTEYTGHASGLSSEKQELLDKKGMW
jgi:hypothetical protein